MGEGQSLHSKPVPAGDDLVVDGWWTQLGARFGIPCEIPTLAGSPVNDALTVLGRAKCATNKKLITEEGHNASGGVGHADAGIGLKQTCVIEEHALVVRIGEVPHRGVAKETTLNSVPQGRVCIGGKQTGGKRPCFGIRRGCFREQKVHHRRGREFRCPAKATMLSVLLGDEGIHNHRELIGGGHSAGSRGGPPMIGQRLDE